MKKRLLILAYVLCFSLSAQAQAIYTEYFNGTTVPGAWGVPVDPVPPHSNLPYAPLTANDKLIITMNDSVGPQQSIGGPPQEYSNFYYAVDVTQAFNLASGCKCVTFDFDNTGNPEMTLYVQAGDDQQNVGGVYNHYTDNTYAIIPAGYVGPVRVDFSGKFTNGTTKLDSTLIKSFDFQPIGKQLLQDPWNNKFKGTFSIDNFRIAPYGISKVYDNSANIISSGTTLTLPTVASGSAGSSQYYYVINEGDASLTVSSITITGANASEFALGVVGLTFPNVVPNQPPGGSDGQIEFAVTFKPTSQGTGKTATVTIKTNDLTTPVFTFVVTADATAPDPQPKLDLFLGTATNGALLQSDGDDNYIAGAASGSTGTAQVFTIFNDGPDPLTISSITKGTANDEAQFILDISSTTLAVAPGATTTFTIKFAPTSVGSGKRAVVEIASNDPLNSTYYFAVAANAFAVGTAPEINVKQGTASGTTVLTGGSTTLPSVMSGTNGTPQTFTIQNTGTASLTISGIESSGPNENEFSISTLSFPLTITAGSSQTFTVTFEPTSVATGKTTTITILNDDADEGMYTIDLTANATLISGVNSASSTISSSKLFPNPVSDQANIELNLVTPSDIRVILSDMMGREIMTIAQGSMSSLTQSFSVANLQKGIYTVSYFVNDASVKSELLMVK